MSVVIPKWVQELASAEDPKAAIMKRIGDLNDIDVLFNLVLLATYIRPEKTTGGIYRPSVNIDEDVWQGKVGLVLKKGANAFLDDERTKFLGQNVAPGDWVMYRVGDALPFDFRGVPCRLLADTHIKMKIATPDLVF